MSNLDEFRTEINSILTEFNEGVDVLVGKTRQLMREAVEKLVGEPKGQVDHPIQIREKGY